MGVTLEGQLVVAICRGRCSTSRKRTSCSSRATTAPTCSCNWTGWNNQPARRRFRWCASCWPSTTRCPAGRGGHPVAQRPVSACACSVRQHYGLPIQRGSFTRGAPPWRYLVPLNANLFLSAHLSDVRAALDAEVPAAQVYPLSARASRPTEQVRIAFDGDAVLFSDEAERVFQAEGLSAFQQA